MFRLAILFFCFHLLSSLSAFAQTQLSTAPPQPQPFYTGSALPTLTEANEDSISIPSNGLLKFTLLKPLQLTNAGLEFGYERWFSQKYSAQASLLYLFPNGTLNLNLRDPGPNIRGWGYSIETRAYLYEPTSILYQAFGKRLNWVYLGLSYDHVRQTFDDVYNFGEYDPSIDSALAAENNYDDSIQVRKRTHTVTLKLGFIFRHKRLFFDAYYGFGIRVKRAAHYGRLRPEDEIAPGNSTFTDRSGINSYPHFALNIRLGYAF